MCLLLSGIVVAAGLVVLDLATGDNNRWRNQAIELWSEPSAAERSAFLEGVRAEASRSGLDHSSIADSDLIDAARFLCSAMATLRKDYDHTPKQRDLDEAVSAAVQRFDLGRAKLRADIDPRVVHKYLRDVDVGMGSVVSSFGFGNLCPKQAPDLRS